MTLASLFDDCLEKPESALFTKDHDDFIMARNSIRAWLEAEGRDLASEEVLQMAVPGWLNDYFEFLVTSYKSDRPKDDRLKWATRYLKCLRKVINHSIRHGLLPNVDCFSGIDRLPDFSRRQGVEEPDSMVRTLALLANRGVRTLSEKRTKTDEADTPEYDFQRVFGPEDLYLLCLYCGGLEVEDLFRIPVETLDPETRTIRLDWAGMEVRISKNVFDALTEFSHSPLFGHASASSITLAMERSGLRLFKGRSVFADWLRYAAERYLEEETVRRLAQLRYAACKECPDDLRQAIQRVTDGLGANSNRYRKQWYCLISHKGSAAERYQELAEAYEREDAVIPFFRERKKDFYFLEEERKKPRNGKKRGSSIAAVLRRHLFACLYTHETELIRQRLDNVRFLRNSSGGGVYATIPYAEMYRLQLVLESIKGSEATLSLEDDEVRDAIDTTPLALREKVTIAKPGYEGYEAEVIKIGSENRYTVRFPNLNWNLVMTDVPRALIHPLQSHSAKPS